MQKHMPNLWFRLMTVEYAMRSRRAQVSRDLEEAGVRPGMTVLDFGCGPGRYALPTARRVAAQGLVHAVDVHPLAVRRVQRLASAEGLTNIHGIHTDCRTGLAPRSVDIAPIYDALHDVEDKPAILDEIARVLKSEGTLSYRDHTLNGPALLSLMEASGFHLRGETASFLAFVLASAR